MRRLTESLGCAPFEIQSLTFASSMSMVDGLGLRVVAPDDLDELPSRGERESATTTR